MAQPPAYNKTRNFSTWQASNPNTVYAGSDLDQEFDHIETTLDATLNNLAVIQRDDGKLANVSVHQDSLSSAVLALIASTWVPKGLWVTATAYIIGDVVEDSGSGYVCSVAHTSGTFATDHTAGKWVAINGGVAASGISVSPVGSLVASNAQSAFQELDADLTAHIGDATAAHAATAISNTPAGNIAATTVQAAINELDTEKAVDASVVHLTGNETVAGVKTFDASTGGTPLAVTASSSGNATSSITAGTATVQSSVTRSTSGNTGTATNHPFAILVNALVKLWFATTGGIYTPNATGGDKGADTLNASALYENGKRVFSDTSMFESAETAVTVNSTTNLAHGLGAVPKLAQMVLRCKTAELGYSVGDEVFFSSMDAPGAWAVNLAADATNVSIILSLAPRVAHKTTWAQTSITAANWKWVARAWA